ncbi:MAG: hypothetical protein ACOCXG_00250 [Nanoarchaeota archaeon]
MSKEYNSLPIWARADVFDEDLLLEEETKMAEEKKMRKDPHFEQIVEGKHLSEGHRTPPNPPLPSSEESPTNVFKRNGLNDTGIPITPFTQEPTIGEQSSGSYTVTEPELKKICEYLHVSFEGARSETLTLPCTIVKDSNEEVIFVKYESGSYAIGLPVVKELSRRYKGQIKGLEATLQKNAANQARIENLITEVEKLEEENRDYQATIEALKQTLAIQGQASIPRGSETHPKTRKSHPVLKGVGYAALGLVVVAALSAGGSYLGSLVHERGDFSKANSTLKKNIEYVLDRIKGQE